MELAVSDLRTQLSTKQNSQVKYVWPLRIIRSIAYQVLSGLDYLHRSGIVHRDLKAENILVTKWDIERNIPIIKLGDFGLAREFSGETYVAGTKGYLAPEIQEALDTGSKALFTPAVDIWTFGKVLSEFIEKSHQYGKAASFVPALRLTTEMMHQDSKLRPTAAACLQNPWLDMEYVTKSSLAEKRIRSPDPSLEDRSRPVSTAGEPIEKVIKIDSNRCFTTRNEQISPDMQPLPHSILVMSYGKTHNDVSNPEPNVGHAGPVGPVGLSNQLWIPATELEIAEYYHGTSTPELSPSD
ncbi:cell division control protein 15 [Sclerotinia borealis F-4128]|uniref:Cell division control protein 15 n=1 Tax=Sclerotinia borealis (strain F-4128) TaxID=1432307 RepID=W9CQF4_SCLBF|nr:cell division control protein 15 [Sclerotinia borealis F-4128]